MSESFVQLNTDGVGKKIDTWTESTNNQHRQAMVIADPSTTLNVAFVTAANALKVDGSSVTQPISGSITVLNASIPVTQSGIWTTGRTWTLLNTTDSVNVGNFPATQPVSGTVTANQGTAAALASAWPVEIAGGSGGVGGTNLLRVDTGGNTVTKLVDAGGTNFATVTSSNALKVDGSSVTQPVSGTVTTTPPNNASTNLTQVGGAAIALGQTITAASIPVTIASNQSNLSVLTPDLTSTISLTAVNQTASILMSGRCSVAVVTTSMGVGGQLAIEYSIDGLNWISVDFFQESTDSWIQTITTADSYWGEGLGAINSFRVRVTAITSGTITGTILAGKFANGKVEYQGSTGTTFPPNLILVGGKTNDATPQFQSLPEGTGGRSIIVEGVAGGTAINVVPSTPTIATYTATITALATAALATDIFTVTGSATKTVKIRRFIVSGSQTTAGSVRFITLRRSTADTAGASTNPTAVTHDTTNPAATAVVTAYTANPTLGTLVGNMITKNVIIEVAAATTDFQGWDYTQDEAVQPVTLRGVTQQWCINLGGVTVAGSSLNISVVWTEE